MTAHQERPDDSEFVKHTHCDACGSTDGNSVYSDGHTHCFVCQAHTGPSDGLGPSVSTARPKTPGGWLLGDVRSIPTRRLSEAACQKFGYKVATDKNGKLCQVADYRASDGTLVAQKLRYADKTFSVIGGGNMMPLFGQNLWSGGGKRLIITEGEIDAISVAQVLGLSWPAVSVPNGASGALKAIKANLEFVESFEQVIFAFDMDEPGRKAAAECAEVLTPGKAHIAELPFKDANECLKQDAAKALTTALWQARCVRPDGIVSLGDIAERVMAEVKPGLPWMFGGMTEKTFGRYPGDVIGIGAAVGGGKTDFLVQQISYDINTLGLTVGAILLEQDVGDTGKRVAGKLVGKTFHVPDGSWTRGELADAWKTLEDTNRLFLYDNFGSSDWATIKGKIRYLHEALGCSVIYLDHLTALIASETDERRSLDAIMADLAGMAKGKFILIFVSHLTTPDGKAHEEGGRVSSKHFTGSRAIMRWAHVLFGIERNQQAEDREERLTSTIRNLKDRLSGRALGETWQALYDPATGLLAEKDWSKGPGGETHGF